MSMPMRVMNEEIFGPRTDHSLYETPADAIAMSMRETSRWHLYWFGRDQAARQGHESNWAASRSVTASHVFGRFPSGG
jgi:acyl-CoA reductase-like NAD-dependent aldehyde dehydrogenase